MQHTTLSRRAFLLSSISACAGTLSSAETTINPIGVPLRQEPLLLDFGELEPYLDAATLKRHYQEHHAAHLKELILTLDQVNLKVANVVSLLPNIQTLIEPTDTRRSVVRLGKKPGPLPPEVQNEIRMHGGGHVNHTIFWRFLAPPGSGPSGPENAVKKALENEFGTIADFKAVFTKAALSHFGSGWVWLVYRPDGKLVITTTANEDSPLMKDFVNWQDYGRPILALDLWEHSYYLKYQNSRAKYIEAWWNIVNWKFVSKAYAIVTKTRL